ncbi:MAG: hypothetical protein ACM3MK_11875 [Chitinophagales bacterium]
MILAEKVFGLIDPGEKDVLTRCRQVTLGKIRLVDSYPQMFDFFMTAFFNESEQVRRETENKNRVLIDLGYAKLFGGIDETLFKDEFDVKQVLSVITWTMEGLSRSREEKLKNTTLSEVDYDEIIKEVDVYLKILRQCFYK